MNARPELLRHRQRTEQAQRRSADCGTTLIDVLAVAVMAVMVLVAIWHLPDDAQTAPSAPDYSQQQGART